MGGAVGQSKLAARRRPKAMTPAVEKPQLMPRVASANVVLSYGRFRSSSRTVGDRVTIVWV